MSGRIAAASFCRIEKSGGLRIEIGDDEALTLKIAHGVEHRLVFGGHCDQMLSLALVKSRRTGDREVVGLGRAGGPNDLLRVGIDQPRHLLARRLDRFFGFPSVAVRAAGRIAEALI